MAGGCSAEREGSQLTRSVAFKGYGRLELQEIGQGAEAVPGQVGRVCLLYLLPGHEPFGAHSSDFHFAKGQLFLGKKSCREAQGTP